MEDKPLTESINKQYSKYGSLRGAQDSNDSKIKLCNGEDPKKFLAMIDSSIKDAKARVKKSIDKSTISDDYESSFDNQTATANDNSLDTIPMVKLERTHQLIDTNNTTTSTTEHYQQQQQTWPNSSSSSN